LFAGSIVKPGDTIVTFNYDDALDRELRRSGRWNVSTGYGFPLGHDEGPSEVLLLKLHGSINWLVSLFGGAVPGAFLVDRFDSMGEAPVIHRADLRFLGYEEFAGRIYETGGAPPCLILPGRTKCFFYDTSFGHEFSEFWESLWFQAKTAVQSCDRVVVCGYSLPEADVRARELLFEGVGESTPIEVITGKDSERVAREFREAGISSVTSLSGVYFSDWIQNRVREPE
jgi:hypothetical protein